MNSRAIGGNQLCSNPFTRAFTHLRPLIEIRERPVGHRRDRREGRDRREANRLAVLIMSMGDLKQLSPLLPNGFQRRRRMRVQSGPQRMAALMKPPLHLAQRCLIQCDGHREE